MTQLVGRYERPLFRFLFQLTNDTQLAEDIFQECFLRLHRSRNAYRAGQPLKPYLYRIALNALHDARAKRPTTVSLDDPSHRKPGAGEDALSSAIGGLAANAPRPGDELDRSE